MKIIETPHIDLHIDKEDGILTYYRDNEEEPRTIYLNEKGNIDIEEDIDEVKIILTELFKSGTGRQYLEEVLKELEIPHILFGYNEDSNIIEKANVEYIENRKKDIFLIKKEYTKNSKEVLYFDKEQSIENIKTMMEIFPPLDNDIFNELIKEKQEEALEIILNKKEDAKDDLKDGYELTEYEKLLGIQEGELTILDIETLFNEDLIKEFLDGKEIKVEGVVYSEEALLKFLSEKFNKPQKNSKKSSTNKKLNPVH
jgi:hypothetical protein